MNTDIRIAIGFWDHPKTLRLVRVCGYEGGACLQRLWMWAAQNRPDGSLHGMDDVDIELAAGWRGEDGKLFNSIVGKWIDGENGSYVLHEWRQHNPWACGATAREGQGRFKRMKATHKAIHALLNSKGVTSVSKDFYATITTCGLCIREIAAMLPGEYPELFQGNGEGNEPVEPEPAQETLEGELKQPSEPDSSNAQAEVKQCLSGAQSSLEAGLSGASSPKPYSNANAFNHVNTENLKDISSSELPTENPEAEAEGEDDGDEGSKKTDSAAKPDKTFAEDSDAYRVSLFLFNCIAHRKPDFKKPNLQAWARHADLMLRLDKRDLESVQKVIRWCQADTFWQSNILSTAKLREKFDQLDDRMKSNGGGNGAGKQILTASGNPKHSGFTPNSGRDYKTGSANSDPESIRKLIGDEEYERIYGKLP